MFGRVRLPARPWFFKKEFEVVHVATARKRAAVTAGLGAVLGAILAVTIYQAFNAIVTPRVPAMAVSPMLFQVGEHLCKQNDGLLRVEIVMPVNDRYTFVCNNGARFEDTVARIRRP